MKMCLITMSGKSASLSINMRQPGKKKKKKERRSDGKINSLNFLSIMSPFQIWDRG